MLDERINNEGANMLIVALMRILWQNGRNFPLLFEYLFRMHIPGYGEFHGLCVNCKFRKGNGTAQKILLI